MFSVSQYWFATETTMISTSTVGLMIGLIRQSTKHNYAELFMDNIKIFMKTVLENKTLTQIYKNVKVNFFIYLYTIVPCILMNWDTSGTGSNVIILLISILMPWYTSVVLWLRFMMARPFNGLNPRN